MNSIGNMASIWTPFTYTDSSEPYYRPALGVVIALMVISGITATGVRFYLARENKRFERMESADAELREQDVQKLRKTAELEGVDIAAARQMAKGFRYVL